MKLVKYLFWILLLTGFQLQSTKSWREHNFDVLHYKIEVEFEHDLGKVIGRTTITLSPKKNNFKSFKLDAHKFEDVKVSMETDTNLESIIIDTSIIKV